MKDKGVVYYKTYYTAKVDALKARRKGDRIYYSSELKAYYIVRRKRRGFWWLK